jgi:CRISPR-associated endonuclease/helicase Cas3
MIRSRLGPDGQRPHRLVIVTTSMLDVSMNVDLDLIVSDLTSLHRLLQRSGRLWRFEELWHNDPGRRPAWVRAQGPRMTVLHPVEDSCTSLPSSWRPLESAFLTHATGERLAASPHLSVTMPHHVQQLIEPIHGIPEVGTESPLHQHLLAHHRAEQAEEHLSADHLIPPPRQVSSLADLHRQYLTTAQAATRIGTLPRRILPCYRTGKGPLTLDPAGRHPLPETLNSPDDARIVLQHTLPAPAAWVAYSGSAHAVPDTWRHPLLVDLVLLVHDTDQLDSWLRFGPHALRMDAELGLLHRDLREEECSC